MNEYIVIRKSDGTEVYRYQSEMLYLRNHAQD